MPIMKLAEGPVTMTIVEPVERTEGQFGAQWKFVGDGDRPVDHPGPVGGPAIEGLSARRDDDLAAHVVRYRRVRAAEMHPQIADGMPESALVDLNTHLRPECLVRQGSPVGLHQGRGVAE